MKRIILAAAVWIAMLGFTTPSRGDFFIDQEHIVVFRPGISWEEAAAAVQGWGSTYHLATITTREEQRYWQRLLRGLRGDFWLGGYRDDDNEWRWVTGEPWDYTRWARGEPDSASYLSMRGGYGGRAWRWRDKNNSRRISGFLVERDLRPDDTDPIDPVVPIPAAAWLFGSGLAVLGGLRLARRRDYFSIG